MMRSCAFAPASAVRMGLFREGGAIPSPSLRPPRVGWICSEEEL